MSVPSGLESIRTAPSAAVRFSDRLWDLTALALVLGGVGLFFFGRHALDTLGAGTYKLPRGVTYVSRADLHVAQTRIGIYCIAMGILVGVAAALRHRFRAR
jgi:uncharacterized membrane protein YidH (DUF202 family)